MTSPTSARGAAPMIPRTMRALTRSAYAPEGAAHVADFPVPQPGPGEVLLQVAASSVNFADLASITGEPLPVRAVTGLRTPKHPVPGRDVAGTVVALGSDVTELSLGDQVFGELDAGSFAEYAVAPVRHLAHLPDGLGLVEAATLPLAGLTALQGLRDAGRLQEGQSVLVSGASGGVGTFAVSIAAALGGTVTAVCSSRNLEQAMTLGASAAIDATTPWREVCAQGPYDLVLNIAGGHTLTELRAAVAPRGTLVNITGRGGRVLSSLGLLARTAAVAPFTRQRLVGLAAHRSVADLHELGKMVASGQVRPAIEAAYPLEHADQAIQHVLVERARSKIVIAAQESTSQESTS